MKQVISGIKVKESMQEAINLLCDTVKVTLGPIGKNVIVDNSCTGPIITNDGVTIAKEIESDAKVVNTVLTIAKEASIKTNEEVGDGTTSSLVFLQRIFNEGMEKINNGYNPIILKDEMNDCLVKVTKYLKESSIKLKRKDILPLALVTSGNKEISELIDKAYQEVGIKGTISITEGNTNKSYLEVVKGMQLESGFASPYFAKNKKEEVLKNPYLLITNHKINDLSEIQSILESVIQSKRSLLIIADDIDDKVLETLVLNKVENILNVVLVKSPYFAIKKDNVLEDVSILTNGAFINKEIGKKLSDITLNDLGECREIKVTDNATTIIDGLGKKEEIIKRSKEIELEIKNSSSSFDKEYLEERLAKLNKGIAIIHVGGNSRTELIERKLRTEDAICAIKTAFNNGIVMGGGVTYLKVKSILIENKNNVGSEIILSSLSAPLEQIAMNSGFNYNEIYKTIKDSNFTKGYDALNKKYGDLLNLGIIDPVSVDIAALTNAVSIASILLTTENIIIDKSEVKDLETEYSNIC